MEYEDGLSEGAGVFVRFVLGISGIEPVQQIWREQVSPLHYLQSGMSGKVACPSEATMTIPQKVETPVKNRVQ
jgi:hypothetical protein